MTTVMLSIMNDYIYLYVTGITNSDTTSITRRWLNPIKWVEGAQSYVNIHPYVHPSIHISIHLSIHISICTSIHPTINHMQYIPALLLGDLIFIRTIASLIFII